MPNVGSRTVQAKETVGGTTFKNFVNVQAYSGDWKPAKKVFAHNGTGWTEVWNNRPVTTTGTVSSSAYDRFTATGTVDPNNFDSTPRFFYKKNADASYTQDANLTVISGDGAQSVGSRTITGLTENTVYNVYLSAINAAGTSDIPSIVNVTTGYDCRVDGSGYPLGTGWSSSVSNTTESCGTCGTRTKTVTTYTKTGCVNSVVTTYGTCTESTCGCATANTNGWSATQTRTRTVSCGTCGTKTQAQDYITKSGCTEVVTRDWYDTTSCAEDTCGCATAGTNGWVAGSRTRTVSCGVCGTKTQTQEYISKSGCTEVVTRDWYDTTTCAEDACGCTTANTNGWSSTQTRTRYVGCGSDGCSYQRQDQDYITKSGCSEVITRDWYNVGGCTSNWQRLDPDWTGPLYNYLGDGVNWFPLGGYGGYWPSNNPHGNGCYGSSYALWYLYRCPDNYVPNSRTGQYEVNTGLCGAI